MGQASLLEVLAGTLDADLSVRKSSEVLIKDYEQQPGFTTHLLELVNDNSTQFGIKLAAAIMFKNRISDSWIVPENKLATSYYLTENEKSLIKENLIKSIICNYKNQQLKIQLASSLHKILGFDKWEGILDLIKKLLSDNSNPDHIYTGLICLFEYTKNYRWVGLENASSSNPILEEIADEIFPELSILTSNLIESSDSVINDGMLYLIIKTFKFVTYSSLPSYFQNQQNLGNWCGIHAKLINKPLPQYILSQEPDQRESTLRIKSVKWGFGNLNRLLNRHGGGSTTKDKSSEFVSIFLKNFVPEILTTYWKIIENWSTKSIWLSEPSLFHLISFLEQLITTPAYDLISDKLEAIIKHVLLPTLNATDETIELYEDDPDEYIRRFFDSRDSNTADIASVNFFIRLSMKKFKSTINLVLEILNDIFTRRNLDRNNIEVAKEVEGALRVMITIAVKLASTQSPVYLQFDNIIHGFVFPELSEDTVSKFPWLTARACDTISIFTSYSYKDKNILGEIFQGIIRCFQIEDQFPIQVTAVDALCTLVSDDSVADHIADQAPQLMGTLLDMSKRFESEVLTTVMEAFVDRFAKNLEPYATQLASNLVEQFLKIANELCEPSSEFNTEKEYQAAGHLNTLGTLVRAMNHSPAVANSLEDSIQEAVRFVLENAQISFLSEVMEIIEFIILFGKQVSPIMWGLFKECIDAFDTYAFEYFDVFVPFFQRVINSGFVDNNLTLESPYVQSLLKVCFDILTKEDADPIFADKAFELLELTILAMGSKFLTALPQFLNQFYDIYKNYEVMDAFDGFMLHRLSILKIIFASIYIDARTTINFINDKQFMAEFFNLWLKHSEDFQSVYGCKLQVLASLSILSESLQGIPEDLLGELVDLLLSNLSALPAAIKAKNEILQREGNYKHTGTIGGEEGEEEDDEYEAYDYEDDLEADEAELDALLETPIDQFDIFNIAATQFVNLKQDEAKFHFLFQDISEEKQKLISDIVELTGIQK